MSKDVEIRDNTKQFLDLFEKAKVRALEKIGLAAEGYAKRGTPVDTGRLRNSITYAIAGKQAHVESYTWKKKKKSKTGETSGAYNGTAEGRLNSAVYIGSNVEYASDVELGTRGRAGVHMLQSAATGHSDEYKKIMERELKNG